MRIRTRARVLPKRGNRADEYEDAFWPPSGERAVGAFRCAVADGATEASFSGIWAQMLVRAYCKGWFGPRRRQDALNRLGRQWRGTVGGRPLPWYAEEKLREGAFSSLVGMNLRPCGGGWCWDAVAAGDSCLLQMRMGELVCSFPLQHWTEFDSRPHLLSSNARYNGDIGSMMQVASGPFEPGDIVLLMTDALAAWYLRAMVDGEDPWCQLVRVLEDETAFGPWIDSLRDARQLRNDDVTLLAIDMLQ